MKVHFAPIDWTFFLYPGTVTFILFEKVNKPVPDYGETSAFKEGKVHFHQNFRDITFLFLDGLSSNLVFSVFTI